MLQMKNMTDVKDNKVNYDPVNHPSHYRNGNGRETIESIQDILGLEGMYYYCIGNTLKYLARAGKKGAPNELQEKRLEDWRKAEWYLHHAIEVETRQRELKKGRYE